MSPTDQPAIPSPLGAIGMTAAAWLLLWLVLVTAAESGVPTLGLALGTIAGFGGIGTLAARAVSPPAEEKLGLRGFPPRLLLLLLLLVPAVLLVSELDNFLAVWLKTAAGAGAAAGGGSAQALRALGTLELALFTVGLRPVVEEFFFRGVLLQGVVSRLGAGRGLVLTALLFGLVRSSFGPGDLYHAVSLGSAAFVLGWLFGVVRLASGSLLAPILLSALTTGAGTAAVLTTPLIPIPGFNAPGAHTPLVWLAPAALCVAAGLLWARREWLRRANLSPAVSGPHADDETEAPS